MTKTQKVFTYIFLIVASLLSIFPLVWMVISATNESTAVIRGSLIPGKELFNNLKALMESIDLPQGMWNSFRNSILVTVLSVLVNALAGYAFEIYHDKWKDRVMIVVLVAMMVPFVALMIPLYSMFVGAKLVNTLTALLFPTLASPMLIMLFRQAARSFPMELIESARMDGVSEVGIFFTMYLPIMKSTFAAAFTVAFMSAWNNYLWPLVIFTKNEMKTMPLLISNLQGMYQTDYGVLMLAVTFCTLPAAIVFLILQKSFANGITGAVKG